MEPTMDLLVHDLPVRPTSRYSGPDGVTAAYGSGYADGITLLHANGHNRFSPESLEIVHDRYLCNAQLKHPTAEVDAYIAGFHDVAADNLRCPPHGT
jgi:hypothetical protein